MDNRAQTRCVSALIKQLKYLRTNGLPGLCNESRDVLKLGSCMNWDEEDCLLLENKIKDEELQIQIPFAGTNLCVKFVFNADEPWIPPDFVFKDVNFMKTLLEREDLQHMLPSLDNWNYLSEDIIATLLIQFYKLYKEYQISLTGGTGWMASLLLRLPLDLKDVPPILIDENPGTPTCLLHVSIKKNSGIFSPTLYLSPPIENLIGGSSTLGLPTVPAGTSLTEYVTKILELLENKVKSTIHDFEIRKQLIAQFLCCMGTSLIEYDSEKFFTISFLLDSQDFNFILSVSLMNNFPKNPPLLTLYSVYHEVHGEPFCQTIEGDRMNPQQSSEDMVNSIKASVLEFLPIFKKQSIENSKS